MDWLERLPRWVKVLFVVGGALLAAFASKLPEGFQTVGAYGALVFIAVGVIAAALHWVRERRGGSKVEAIDLIRLGLVGMAVFAIIAVAGLMWRYIAPPPPLTKSPTSVAATNKAVTQITPQHSITDAHATPEHPHPKLESLVKASVPPPTAQGHKRRVVMGSGASGPINDGPKPAEPEPHGSVTVTNSPGSIIAPSGGVNTIIDQSSPEIFSVNEGDAFDVPAIQYCVVNVVPRKSSTPTTIYLPANPIKNAVIEIRYVIKHSGDGGTNMIGIYLREPAIDANFVTGIFSMGESTRVIFDGERWSAAS